LVGCIPLRFRFLIVIIAVVQGCLTEGVGVLVERSKRVLVVGLARSGRAVAHLLLQHGFEVLVNDRKEVDAADAELGQLADQGVEFVCGGHPLSLLDNPPGFIVKNPGIPYTVPLIQAALERGVPIYTEIEVAAWYAFGEVIAITGSNGKTTTTTLVGEMLAAAGRDPVVAGNIGRAFSGVVGDVHDGQPIVLEVSSFQLLGTERFRPHIGVLLNLYPAHLDYHGTFAAYIDAKWKMFQSQTATDYAVLNADDALLRERSSVLQSRVWWFTTRSAAEIGVDFQGACVEANEIVVYDGGSRTSVVRVDEIGLPGAHNLQNALAATVICWLAGVAVEPMRNVLIAFQGVEHRLEFVRSKNDVAYYNDSKSTNPTASLQALRSVPGEIVWIAGGLERNDDLTGLEVAIRQRVKAAVVYGQTGSRFADFCNHAGVPIVRRVDGLEQAVLAASSLARPGDTVLLSPACASWDMFTSFEERGSMFKEVVHRL